MSNPWDSWPKPWTKQQCEIRYIQGDRIGLRGLEVESGVKKSTLEIWSRESSPTWPDRRRQYIDSLQTAIQEKTIEALSDELASELSNVSLEHFSAYGDAYWLAREYCSAQRRIATQMSNLADRDKYITGLNPVALDKISLCLDRSIRGMRMVAGLQYEDYGQAIAFLKRGGYEVVESSESNQSTTEAQTED